MLFLLLAIVTSSLIFIAFKLFEKNGISNIQAITVNYLTAVIIGYLSTEEIITTYVVFGKPWFYFSVGSGILLIVTFLVYAYSIQKVGIAITSVSGKMSVIIPVLLGLLVFQEEATWIRIIGIVTALLAFYLTLMKNREQKAKAIFFVFPVLLFLGNGLNDCVLKISQELYIQNDFSMYLTIAFGVSLIAGAIIITFLLITKQQKIHYKNLIAGIILGILNWYSTYFFFAGLAQFDVSVFIPVFNASVVCIAALTGYWFFKEKLSGINIVGIALAVIAIIFIAWK
ncbi:MAG TPA: DMT family transporter [Bacteroidales bacterium]|nr:DMT family transporter [Bacteroidales bacterium]HOH84301.1 DMT family transporter [Bacteroidales bacterium]HPI30439.1 DMT family transporter [Bacteroidales bacterium]